MYSKRANFLRPNSKALLFLFLLQSGFLFSMNLRRPFEYVGLVSKDEDQEMVEYDIPGVARLVPKNLKDFVEEVKKQSLNRHIRNNFKNMLLLHGASGNGKTTYAEKIAEETGSVFMQLSGASIVGSYMASGPAKIAVEFEKIQLLMEQGKRVLLFIDEIDGISPSDNINKSNHEYNNALKELWLHLDNFRTNPRLVVVFATNNFASLQAPFKNRFGVYNIVEIKNPGPQMRKEIINFCEAKIQRELDPNFKLEPELLNALVKETRGLSIRVIQDIVYNIQRLSLELANVAVAIDQGKKNNSSQDEKSLKQTILEYIGPCANFVNMTINIVDFALKIHRGDYSGAAKVAVRGSVSGIAINQSSSSSTNQSSDSNNQES